ncbi:hypothetical protein KCP77_03240 [Salmonella enterica subsp. enterica]|nr:hypothetical protein KCP77_03240 [Salmonella enterica subsp. enterica]
MFTDKQMRFAQRVDNASQFNGDITCAQYRDAPARPTAQKKPPESMPYSTPESQDGLDGRRRRSKYGRRNGFAVHFTVLASTKRAKPLITSSYFAQHVVARSMDAVNIRGNGWQISLLQSN